MGAHVTLSSVVLKENVEEGLVCETLSSGSRGLEGKKTRNY